MNKYVKQERARYWPVSPSKYLDGTETYKETGDSIWLQDGEQHRDNDKPAVIRADGRLEWWQNGWLHRNGDKPAVISADGRLEWRQNQHLHRTSGPAVIHTNGKLEWWIRDKNITLEVNAWLADTKWQGTPEQIAEFQLRFC